MSRNHHRRVPGTRRKERRLHLAGKLPANASPAAVLARQLRTSAELEDCCVCGARAEFFEVAGWNGDEPELRRLEEPRKGGVSHAVFAHKEGCPVLLDAEREERALTG